MASSVSQARRMSEEALRPFIEPMPGRFVFPKQSAILIHRLLGVSCWRSPVGIVRPYTWIDAAGVGRFTKKNDCSRRVARITCAAIDPPNPVGARSPDRAPSLTEGLPFGEEGDLRSGPGAGSGDPAPTESARRKCHFSPRTFIPRPQNLFPSNDDDDRRFPLVADAPGSPWHSYAWPFTILPCTHCNSIHPRTATHAVLYSMCHPRRCSRGCANADKHRCASGKFSAGCSRVEPPRSSR